MCVYRHLKIKSVFIFALLLCLNACTKKETLTVHEYAVIQGNDVPPNTSVSQIQLNNYINKSYIDLLGREPSTAELTLHTNNLKTAKYSEASRKVMITSLLNSYTYYERFFEMFSSKILQSVDSIQMQNDLEYYPMAIAEANANGFYGYAYTLTIDQANIINLSNAKNDFRNGTIDINTFFYRFIYNPYYDEINMGYANYMLASYQNLFRRFPTADELARGIDMQENTSTSLMGVDGSNLQDLASILTNCDAFYEGLVYDAFDRLLVRVPVSLEMANNTTLIKTSNYKALQLKIMLESEYAGF